MPSRLLANATLATFAASIGIAALASPPAFAQAQPEGATKSAAAAKSAQATANTPARRSLTAATGASPVKPAGQSKAPESAAKTADSPKAGCHHGNDGDA